MRPRVLVLNFQNGRSADDARATAERQVAAVAEGSRYHAYADPAAPPFIRYEIAKVVTSPTRRRRPGGPTRPARGCRPRRRASSTCWRCSPRRSPRSTGFPIRTCRRARCRCASCSNGESSTRSGSRTARRASRRAPLSLERKQSYDGTETAVPGSFAPNAGRPGPAGRHHLRRHRPLRSPRRRARAGLRSGGPRLGDRSDVGGAPVAARRRARVPQPRLRHPLRRPLPRAGA